jgi:lysophospholipase L1-like esterase
VGEWVQGSITMRGLCAARGIPYLHVLQPTLHDRGSKPLTEKEIANSTADPYWIEGVEHVYPKLRAAGDRLAERGIDYVDATRAFTGEIQDLYYDPCHFVEAGNVVLADRIADTLVRACSR